MSGHTPGPWIVNARDTAKPFAIHALDGAPPVIAWTVCYGAPGIASDISDANARLVAAAPDLLATLREIVTEIRAYQSPECDDAGWGADLLKQADAAIAKATGKKTG
jgi:hypothetical protein